MTASGASASATPISNNGRPAKNIWKPKVNTTTAVIPTSGCKMRMATITPTTADAHAQPGKPSCSRHNPNNQAEMMTKIGFINSEGCRRKPPSISHLVAPFTSGPIARVATISPVITMPPSRHKMRIVRSVRIEVTSMTSKAGNMKKICRKTK